MHPSSTKFVGRSEFPIAPLKMRPNHMYTVILYWKDENGGRHLLGSGQYDEETKADARKAALDELWPRGLDAPAAFEVKGVDNP